MNHKAEQQKKSYIDKFTKELRVFDDELLEKLSWLIWLEQTERKAGDGDDNKFR